MERRKNARKGDSHPEECRVGARVGREELGREFVEFMRA
jgi:hypothetical protein